MKLFIDSSDRNKIKVGLDKKIFETEAKDGASQRLLSFIDKVLKKRGTSFNQITEIEVNTGPGSFTGLRIGVSVAQTLGWALGIPVNGKDLRKGESIDIIYK
jgi:tRNA threonylcarbamoyl adenosine modification protein YeaZ